MNGNLKERLLAGGYSVAGVAEAAGTPSAHLYNLLNRVRRPRYALAKRIESATAGLIRWTEFFEEPGTPGEAAAELGHLDLAPGDLDGIEEIHDVAVGVHADHEVQPDSHQRASKPEAA